MKEEENAGIKPDEKDGQINEPSDPIETPEEVPESNDEKIDQDYPGYPHHPANDDILDPENNEGKVDMDVENLTRANKVPRENLVAASDTPSTMEGAFPLANPDEADDLGIVLGTEADVTEEDLLLLGDKDKDMDMNEDEAILGDKAWPLEMTGEDFDVPGSELDDANEAIGEEDEENNYYSLGGDNHESLEEDTRNSY